MLRNLGALGISIAVAGLLAGTLAGCSEEFEGVTTTGAGASGALGGAAGAGVGGHGGNLLMGGQGGSGAQGGADPCASLGCPDDQHCDQGPEGPECVNNTCAELDCSPTEVCEVTAGGGAICADNSCTEHVQCAPEQFCNGTICVDDVCEPGARRCDGLELLECTPSGGGEAVTWTCGGSALFQSQCIDDGTGHAYCSCEDDWDCPAWASCDAGQCTGNGVAPTCFLEPQPFSAVLPVQEIVWGGNPPYPGTNTYAANSPYPPSSQVVMMPLVVNLDDDNGDGLVNELDFPEIVFSSFCASDISTNGMLRAIHGGGPNKGKDFFASCNATTAWHEGDALPATCACASAELDSTSSIAAGDLQGDGLPELVAFTETNAIRIFSHTGDVLATSAVQPVTGANPAPAIANLDGVGPAEIIVGRVVLTLGTDVDGALQFVDSFAGTAMTGINGQGPIACVANVLGDERLEIIAGSTVYRFPRPPAGATTRADCVAFPPTSTEETAFCQGQLVIEWNGAVEGFCAVADVLGTDQTTAPGPNNPLDELPEVVLVSAGSLRIYNAQDGTLRRNLALNVGTLGGAPNVDDFDGDGFPEIGTAAATAYVVVDLQDAGASCPAWPGVGDGNATLPRTPPATACASDDDCGDLAQFACNEATSSCVCLHNDWRRTTEDDSSQVTGSSVFDFNGDGAAEVVYNDECRFRIYDGLDGTVWFNPASESRTRTEYPVIADVDNDGNAEIVFPTGNESGFCSQNLDTEYNNGIEVWGDASDSWVSARRIWNEHAYHVTNVTEGGAIPLHEPASWLEYQGRRYNVYRSNPRSQGVAPDLAVQAVQVSSPDATCGQLSDLLDITVQIANLGDLRVGPGVVVSFVGDWSAAALVEPLYADAVPTPLEFVIQDSLEPGDAIFLTVSYDAQFNSPGVLPDSVTVTVDATSLERECNESNNALEKLVEPGEAMADLRVALGAPGTNPCPSLPTTVYNDGSADAQGVVVRYFAGDPDQGGYPLHDEVLAAPVPAGGAVSFDVVLADFPQAVDVVVWAWVDPDDHVAECNDGNNQDDAATAVRCGGIN